MRKMNRLLSLFLALIIAMAMFVSCVNNGDDKETTPADTQTGDPADSSSSGDVGNIPEAVDLKIIVNGVSNITVMRPDKADNSSMVVACATDIRKAIGDYTSVTPAIKTDWTKDGTHDPNTVEILVGNTDYAETAAVLSELSYGEYVVKVVGNKLVVAAYTDTALRAATNKLIKQIKELSTEGNLTIPADLLLAETVDKDLAALPSYDGGTFYATYSCGGEAMEIIVKNTNADEYQKYLKKLEENGYTQYTTNTIKDNHFATYNNKNYTISAGFYKYENAARIIIEDLAPAVGLESDNKYTAVTTSQITMIGTAYTTSSGDYNGNGLSMLIRLTDGRFIVVDGGHNKAENSANLLKAMKEQSSGYLKAGEKITVAAWIITHSHGDHNGMINSQYGNFTSSVKVERFLVNFMAESERQKAISSASYGGNWSSGEGGGYTTTLKVASNMKAVVHTVRVGQVFYFADLKLEVLYTIDSYGPEVCNALNTTSLIMKMTFGDGTVYMSTGDATGPGMQIVSRMFGDYLKSDIVQVAHHGYSTWGTESGTIAAYKLMQPSIVLWPQGLKAYPNYKTKSYNIVLFPPAEGGSNPNFKEILISGEIGDTVIVPIPYTLGSAIVKRTS